MLHGGRALDPCQRLLVRSFSLLLPDPLAVLAPRSAGLGKATMFRFDLASSRAVALFEVDITLRRIFGIGLILFNAKDSQQPAFEIRVRAGKHELDMFYVNRCMRLIEDQLFG